MSLYGMALRGLGRKAAAWPGAASFFSGCMRSISPAWGGSILATSACLVPLDLLSRHMRTKLWERSDLPPRLLRLQVDALPFADGVNSGNLHDVGGASDLVLQVSA